MIDVKQVVRGLVAVALSLVAANACAQASPAETPPVPAAPVLAAPVQAAPAQAAPAQTAPDTQKPYEPTVSQAGKDVVWVPTPQPTVDNMLALSKLTPQDYLIDLGSGDGITVISAAKKGARAHGVEFNPDMVALSERKAKEAGVSDKATFAQGDLYEADLSKATVITLFLLPNINLKLRPSLLELKPGTRIVSNTFDMGDWHVRRRGDVGGLHVVVQGDVVGGAGQGRRLVAAGRPDAHPHPAVPDGVRLAGHRQ